MMYMYTREDCELCVKAKQLLNDNKIQYDEYVIGKDVTRESIFEKYPGLKNKPTKLPLIVDPDNIIINTQQLNSLRNNVLHIGD